MVKMFLFIWLFISISIFVSVFRHEDDIWFATFAAVAWPLYIFQRVGDLIMGYTDGFDKTKLM